MSATSPVSDEAIAQSFADAMRGKLDDEKIDAGVQALKAPADNYPCSGTVASFIFYLRFSVTVTGGKTFTGNAGGLAVPGGGALQLGGLKTNDLNRLYSDTVSFQFTAAPASLVLIFFDGSSNVLGSAGFLGLSWITGIGGGTGSWS